MAIIELCNSTIKQQQMSVHSDHLISAVNHNLMANSTVVASCSWVSNSKMLKMAFIHKKQNVH